MNVVFLFLKKNYVTNRLFWLDTFAIYLPGLCLPSCCRDTGQSRRPCSWGCWITWWHGWIASRDLWRRTCRGHSFFWGQGTHCPLLNIVKWFLGPELLHCQQGTSHCHNVELCDLPDNTFTISRWRKFDHKQSDYKLNMQKWHYINVIWGSLFILFC